MTIQNNIRQDKTRQNTISQAKTIQANIRQDKPRQDNTTSDKTRQYKHIYKTIQGNTITHNRI